MSPTETLTLAAYFFVLIILAVYGWHRYYLVYLYMTNRDKESKPGALPDPLPVVTVQLPLYNEMYVADRLIEAVCRLEYPRDRLEIQVLDDSIDETCSIAERAVRRFEAQGVDIKYYHPNDRSGRFFNFNGTAGVWRRLAIDEAGGWQHDTLTEDLDLSYRAQLRGWQFVFVSDLVAPAEVPVEMNAFKSQQHRWAKGSIQTCRKLLPRILRSNLPLGVKAEAFFHLSANFNYPLMCVLSVLMAPSMVIRYNMGWYEMLLIDVPLFFAATASVANFYMVCQRELHDDWLTRAKYLPFLMSIGIGLTVNNTRAVLEALFNKKSEFTRTPKYRIEGQEDEWIGKKYRQNFVIQPMIELALGLYFTATVFYALANGIYGTLPFLMLFQIGFLYTGLLSIVQQYAGDGVVLKPAAEAKEL